MKHLIFLKNFFALWLVLGPIQGVGFWLFGTLAEPSMAPGKVEGFSLFIAIFGGVLALLMALGTWDLKE